MNNRTSLRAIIRYPYAVVGLVSGIARRTTQAILPCIPMKSSVRREPVIAGTGTTDCI